MQILLLISLTLLLGECCYCREEWIDPHAMEVDLDLIYGRNPQNSKKTPDGRDTGNTERSYCYQTGEAGSCSAYFRRLINHILNSATLEKNTRLEIYSGTIHLNISEHDYLFLKSFANGLRDGSADSFQKIDDILTEAFIKTTYEQYMDIAASFGDQVYYVIFNKVSVALCAATFVLLFVYKLAQTQFSLWFVFKCLFLVFYVIDFVITYLHLIEAEEIKNIVNIRAAGSLPPECDPQKMSWLTYFSYLFKTENNCLQYYKATYQNLYYLVTPLKVWNHQFGILVVGPITYLGTALGAFTQQILSELPWGINVVLLPLIFVFCCILVMILSVSLLGSSIKFHLFPFLGLEFGTANGKQSRADMISGSNLETLLHTHRQFIEEVKDKPKITSAEAGTRTKSQKVASSKNKKPLLVKIALDNREKQCQCKSKKSSKNQLNSDKEIMDSSVDLDSTKSEIEAERSSGEDENLIRSKCSNVNQEKETESKTNSSCAQHDEVAIINTHNIVPCKEGQKKSEVESGKTTEHT